MDPADEIIARMKREQAQRPQHRLPGFTLSEALTVLVLMAVFLAISVPMLTSHIAKAEERAAIAECRLVVLAAQTVASEHYGTADTLDGRNAMRYDHEILALAELDGSICALSVTKGKVERLVYLAVGEICITYADGAYAVTPEACAAAAPGAEDEAAAE